MKNKILIIEDNYYKYFATKQVLESQLKVGIEVVGATNEDEMNSMINEMMPYLIINRPKGGIADLLTKMKRRKINRRNSEIVLMIAPDSSYQLETASAA